MSIYQHRFEHTTDLERLEEPTEIVCERTTNMKQETEEKTTFISTDVVYALAEHLQDIDKKLEYITETLITLLKIEYTCNEKPNEP